MSDDEEPVAPVICMTCLKPIHEAVCQNLDCKVENGRVVNLVGKQTATVSSEIAMWGWT